MKKKFLILASFVCGCTLTQAQTLKGYDKENMDLSVKPGDDFRQYATGNFLKNHPLRADQMINGAFNDLYDQNQEQIQQLILQFANAPQEPGTLGQKIGTLYNQKMDVETRDRQGLAPIMPLIEKIRAVKDIKEYQRATAEIDILGQNTMMFGWGVGADMRNADMNIVAISQGGTSLERDYYLNDDEQSKQVRAAYMKYGATLFKMLGYDETTAQQKVEAVFALEKRMATVNYSRVKLRDVDANYHKYTYKQLVDEFPGIDWPTIFWVSAFPAFNEVIVEQPEPIHEVEKIYADTPLETLKAYAEVRIIAGGASSLTSELRKAQFELISTMTGKAEDDPMWKQATNTVNSVLSDAIGQMYCEKYFPASSKERMLTMVHNLQKALGQRIDEASWMSAETKAQAKDKLMNFTVKIGYPDKWKDYAKLNISDSLSLYENLNNISEFFWRDMLDRKVNKPVDKSDWMMSPQTINAYYMPTTNEICFPAGILQPPFFNPEADDAINYGAIGGVIGHEMSHGFDDQGCQFDKTGNQRNWWTEADKQNYDKRTKVLETYFDGIEVINGKHINGKQTLGENIGDNGGLNISLRALHNAIADGTAKVLSNNEDGFTTDQRFFLSWARIWASNGRDQYVEMLLNADVHSPNAARINGALPHISEWYDAFGIKKGKLFIPKKNRAQVW